MYLKTASIEELVKTVENYPYIVQGKISKRDILDCDKILTLIDDFYINNIFSIQKEKLYKTFRQNCQMYLL